MAGNVSSDLKEGNTYNLKFTLSDGTVIDAGNIVAPQGEQGPKGDTGAQGEVGATPNVTAIATVDNQVGTPVVTVTKGGTAANPTFTFAFENIKGEQGVQGVQGTQGPKGEKGDTGEAFRISKVYSSIDAMNAGYATDGVPIGGFVIIDTGNVDDADNSRLYVKGESSYTYLTDLSGAQGPKGEKGDTGEAFRISKVYSSIDAMNAGYATDGVPIGGFVIIDTGNVDDADNSRLYVKGESSYTYLTDLSGAQGMKGEKGDTGATPNISMSATVDANVGTPNVAVTKGGTADNPTFRFTFSNIKGERGQQGVQGISIVSASLTEV